jgi:hypothetical protein
MHLAPPPHFSGTSLALRALLLLLSLLLLLEIVVETSSHCSALSSGSSVECRSSTTAMSAGPASACSKSENKSHRATRQRALREIHSTTSRVLAVLQTNCAYIDVQCWKQVKRLTILYSMHALLPLHEGMMLAQYSAATACKCQKISRTNHSSNSNIDSKAVCTPLGCPARRREMQPNERGHPHCIDSRCNRYDRAHMRMLCVHM